MLSFSSRDVLQFLGHRVNVSGRIPANYRGELTTDFKSRASGDRVKYRIDGNSLKGYGKASTPVGDLFRVETLTQNVEVFKTYRPHEGGAEDDMKWRRMRRGVADRTAAPRFLKKPTSAIGTPSARWTTAPGLANSPELWSNLPSIGDGVSALCTPSRPTIISCCKPSIVGNSSSTDSEIETCSHCCMGQSIPLPPSRQKRSAVVRRP